MHDPCIRLGGMFLRTGDNVTHTKDHWADRPQWAGGRRQLTFHLTFAGSGLDGATAGLRAALEALPALDVVPSRWLHLTLTPIGFTDEVDADAAAAVADEVFAGWRAQEPEPAPELWFDTLLIGTEGVLLCPTPASWLDELVGRPRDAVDRHLGARDWHPFWAHASLAYANASIPVGEVTGALEEPAGAASGFAVRPTLSLLELRCADHLYSWRVLRE